MRYILAFTLLFLTACGDEEEVQGVCAGDAQYDVLEGNWVNAFVAGRSNYQHRLRLTFSDAESEEATVTYSCTAPNGDRATVSIEAGYVEHSPEQISIGSTGNMKPRVGALRCETASFGGTRYNLEFTGECISLDGGNGKIYFTKGL